MEDLLFHFFFLEELFDFLLILSSLVVVRFFAQGVLLFVHERTLRCVCAQVGS